MKIKLTVAALVLAVAPSLAVAMGCSGGDHSQQASMSCAEGTMFDAESNSCQPIVSG